MEINSVTVGLGYCFLSILGVESETFHNLYCMYSLCQSELKLRQSVGEHFVLLVEFGIPLITGTCNPGHILGKVTRMIKVKLPL